MQPDIRSVHLCVRPADVACAGSVEEAALRTDQHVLDGLTAIEEPLGVGAAQELDGQLAAGEVGLDWIYLEHQFARLRTLLSSTSGRLREPVQSSAMITSSLRSTAPLNRAMDKA